MSASVTVTLKKSNQPSWIWHCENRDYPENITIKPLLLALKTCVPLAKFVEAGIDNQGGIQIRATFPTDEAAMLFQLSWSV